MLSAEFALRDLKALVIERAGLTEEQWFELWAEAKRRGIIRRVFRNGRLDKGNLWTINFKGDK